MKYLLPALLIVVLLILIPMVPASWYLIGVKSIPSYSKNIDEQVFARGDRVKSLRGSSSIPYGAEGTVTKTPGDKDNDCYYGGRYQIVYDHFPYRAAPKDYWCAPPADIGRIP